jgi:hypothetical protein
VLEPGFLEEVKAAGFVKEDLLLDQGLEDFVTGVVGVPGHLALETAFDGAESVDDFVLQILDVGEYLCVLHWVLSLLGT